MRYGEFLISFLGACLLLLSALACAMEDPIIKDEQLRTFGRGTIWLLKDQASAKWGKKPYTIRILRAPEHGRLKTTRGLLDEKTFPLPRRGLKYNARKGFVGKEVIEYKITDATGLSHSARVTILVEPLGTKDGRYSVDLAYTSPPHLVSINAADNELFKLGYLDVTLYDGWKGNAVDRSGKKDSTLALQKAISDAYDYQLAVFFPQGTYLVSDTLNLIKKRSIFSDGHPTAIVGSTKGEFPMIRLSENAPGFNDPNHPKPIVRVATIRRGSWRAFGSMPEAFDLSSQKKMHSADGFGITIARLRIDCNGRNGNKGAIGMYFPGAQHSHIADVKVNATGAYAGFYEIPSRSSAGAANIEVIGGRYGIYMDHSGANSIIVNAVLKDQEEAAIYNRQTRGVAMVGIHIVKRKGPAIPVQDAWSSNGGTITLVDAIIELQQGGPAFDNTVGKNMYLRNVFIKGANELVKSNSGALKRKGGGNEWNRIQEYAYVDQRKAYGSNFESYTLLNGKLGKKELARVEKNIAPPSDLISRHTWGKLPSFEDSDTVVLTEVSSANGTDDKDDYQALQGVIDKHEKILIPKGKFHVSKPLTLRKNTQLFGVTLYTSRIAPHPSWNPSKEVALVQTVDDKDASTYLGTLSLRTRRALVSNNWITALEWRAGRRSMVMGITVGRYISSDRRKKKRKKHRNALGNPTSLYKVTGNGGGRWYFWGNRKGVRHPDFRYLLVSGTREPLKFYGFNLEHAQSDFQAEIRNSRNVRMYSNKVEARRVLHIHDSKNIALYSSGANSGIGESGQGCYEITGESDQILLANINPQRKKDRPGEDFTVLEDSKYGKFGVRYPNNVVLFKRGEIDEQRLWRAP